MADKTLKVTLVKSPIGAVPKHRRTVEAMGLSKMHKTVTLPDNEATRGQIRQVGYMLKVEVRVLRATATLRVVLFRICSISSPMMPSMPYCVSRTSTMRSS